MSDARERDGRIYELPTTSSERVFNREVALGRLGGNTELLKKLIQFYFDDSERMLRQLREAAVRKDVEVVERSAHTLKSLAANFESLPAVRVALKIEELAQAGNLGDAIDYIPELETQLKRLDEALVAHGEGASS